MRWLILVLTSYFVNFSDAQASALDGEQEAFTLNDALVAYGAASITSDVVSSPKGNYVAWIDRGDVRMATAPDFAPRTLVDHGDGDPVRAIYPSSDGRTIVYLRGMERPGFGDFEASNTRELWQVDVEGSTPQRIAAGDDVPLGPIQAIRFGVRSAPQVVFAPAGEAFAFAEGNVLYEFRRSAEGQWTRRQLLQPELQHLASTGIGDIVYSPDGSKIAFTSVRKARQSYVAIHDIARKQTRYLDPGVFRDSLPSWSPDGGELVFVRDPGNWTMAYRFTPRAQGAPWSIMAADAITGQTRTVWTADRGAGSVAVTSAPVWTGDGLILFTWEKTGWRLLYSVVADGGEARLMTPGEGEVRDIALSPDGKTVVFEANFDDLARRHLWHLDLESGTRPEALTSGAGVEGLPRFIAGGYLLYNVDYREDGPPELMIRAPAGETVTVSVRSPEVAARLDSIWKNFQPVKVEYVRARDGVTSSHILIEPTVPVPAGGYPVVVQAHGGPSVQTLPGGGFFPFGQYLASRGYLYVSMNYRGGTGFGLAYREAAKAGAEGGSEVKDLAALARYLKRRDNVDPKRIGIMGASYGGHIVGQAMSRLPDDFAAGVSFVGVGDWVVELKKDQEDQGGMSAPPPYIRLSERLHIEDLAHESSPTSRPEAWRGPVLFTIGELDRAGHMESAIDLGYRLMERGVPVEFYVDPSGGHRTGSFPMTFDFFERRLR